MRDRFDSWTFLSIYAEALFHRPAVPIYVVGSWPLLYRVSEAYKSGGGLAHLFFWEDQPQKGENVVQGHNTQVRSEPGGKVYSEGRAAGLNITYDVASVADKLYERACMGA
jgi:hypothetical protein